MRKRFGVMVVVLVLMMSLMGGATALTGWQSFGSTTFYSRGTATSNGWTPLNLVSSTTKKNPQELKIEVKGGEKSRRVDISWEVWCDGPQTFVFRSADLTKRVSSSNPWVRTFDAGWITQGDGTFCEVDVLVSHTAFSNTDGKIQVRMFARY